MYTLTESNLLLMEPLTASSVDEIPKGIWEVHQDPNTGDYYLSKDQDLEIPKKLYGDPLKFTDKVLLKFNSTEKNLGVALNGLKGSGKSLQANLICKKLNLPVLKINAPYGGPRFLSFMSKIQQEVVVYFDEFEKTYRENQEGLLTLLDGTVSGKKLFLLTSNSSDNFIDALINRTGRIHYMKTYGGLEDVVIEDVIEDLLLEKDFKEELLNLVHMIGDVNMDCLKSIIKEVNLLKESPMEVVKDMNIQPEKSTSYSCEIVFPPHMNWNNVHFGGSGVDYHNPNPYNRINIDAYIKGYKFVDYEEHSEENLKNTKYLEKVLSGLPKESKERESFYLKLNRSEYSLEKLEDNTIKATINSGHDYEGLELIYTKNKRFESKF